MPFLAAALVAVSRSMDYRRNLFGMAFCSMRLFFYRSLARHLGRFNTWRRLLLLFLPTILSKPGVTLVTSTLLATD